MRINDGSGKRFGEDNPLMKLLADTIGDKRQEEGVTESLSPIDFLPVTELGSLAGAGIKAGARGIMESAPRIIGNEVGSIGNLGKAGSKLIPQEFVNPSIGKNLVQEGADAVKQISQSAINPTSKISKGIKLVPSSYDLEQEAFKKAAEKTPSILEKFGASASENPGQAIDPEKFKAIAELLKRSR